MNYKTHKNIYEELLCYLEGGLTKVKGIKA